MEARHDPEAAKVKAQFDKVWKGSDTPLKSTCLCVAIANQPADAHASQR
jgi:hypothetical protein